jgi:acyl-coenzyme A thioesterase PaaI-like protein
MVDTYGLYRRLEAYQQGRRLFSLVFEQAAPYFRTARPRFTELRPNYAELRHAKRRRVQNHLGTVHVIAICNGLEAAMGALAEATVPRGRRWIPKGMSVEYIAKATSDIRCIAETDPQQWSSGDTELSESSKASEVDVRVRALREDGTTVVEGVIRLHISDRPDRSDRPDGADGPDTADRPDGPQPPNGT